MGKEQGSLIPPEGKGLFGALVDAMRKHAYDLEPETVITVLGGLLFTYVKIADADDERLAVLSIAHAAIGMVDRSAAN